MKSMRRINLHNVLRQKSYDHAILLTFAFSPGFFENYCLERLSSLNENGNISVLVDRTVYDDLIAARDDHGFGDFPAKANIRYLLHPVRVAGRFHPKLFFFASAKRGLLVIGSSNLTRDGISSNAEMIGCYEFVQGEQEECIPLFRDAVRYLIELAQRFPSEQFSSNLNAMLSDATWIERVEPSRSGSLPRFYHNLSTPLWDQIKTAVTSQVKCVHILSRFFDKSPGLLDKLEADFNPEKLRIYTQNGITTLTESWLAHPMVRKRRAEILACYYECEGHPQPLHAKALAFETKDSVTFAFGSANFTTPALLRMADEGNAEAMLVYPSLSLKEFNGRAWFDPGENGIVLNSASELRTAERDKPRRDGMQSLINLIEAWVQDDVLCLKATVRDDFVGKQKVVAIHNNNTRPKPMPVQEKSDGLFKAVIPDELEAQLRRGANIARLRCMDGDEILAESNSVLIVNLQDFKTGRSMRRERHMQEALQNSARFIGVLRELSVSADDQALLQFLQYCDIPLIANTRLIGLRRAGSGFGGNIDNMRQLGERSLRQFFTLHEAVVAFTERHLRRLHRHVEAGTASGIPNFMHILLAVMGLIETQLEKACIAFESHQSALPVEQWHNFRKHADEYLRFFEEAVAIFAAEYVPTMIKGYSKRAVLTGLGDDLLEFRRLLKEAMAIRERIEFARINKLRIQANNVSPIVPEYFNSTFGETKWRDYESTVMNYNRTLEQMIAA